MDVGVGLALGAAEDDMFGSGELTTGSDGLEQAVSVNPTKRAATPAQRDRDLGKGAGGRTAVSADRARRVRLLLRIADFMREARMRSPVPWAFPSIAPTGYDARLTAPTAYPQVPGCRPAVSRTGSRGSRAAVRDE